MRCSFAVSPHEHFFAAGNVLPPELRTARIMNPTNDILEKRFAAMEGGAAALALSSGTSACFYSIINCASCGDNIVSASNLYGGTFTQFHDILPQFGTSPSIRSL